jgi:hypothetical protein
MAIRGRMEDLETALTSSLGRTSELKLRAIIAVPHPPTEIAKLEPSLSRGVNPPDYTRRGKAAVVKVGCCRRLSHETSSSILPTTQYTVRAGAPQRMWAGMQTNSPAMTRNGTKTPWLLWLNPTSLRALCCQRVTYHQARINPSDGSGSQRLRGVDLIGQRECHGALGSYARTSSSALEVNMPGTFRPVRIARERCHVG